MPSPEAQATAAFPEPSPPGGSLSGTQARAGAGAERGLQADPGIPRSRRAGTAPGGSVSLPGQNGGNGCGHGLPLGPGNCLECLRGSVRLPRGSKGKHPHVSQRAPCPAAASALTAAFPPNALPTQTQTHPYRAPQARVAGWEKRRRLPSGPEVVLPRNSSLPRETTTEQAGRSPWKLTGAGRKPTLS